jgi:hypothetical protein
MPKREIATFTSVENCERIEATDNAVEARAKLGSCSTTKIDRLGCIFDSQKAQEAPMTAPPITTTSYAVFVICYPTQR